MAAGLFWLWPGLVAWSQPAPQDASQAPAPKTPSITATPNPVVAASGQGDTTIDWQCGFDEAQVYLAVDGGPEQIFSSGLVGHQKVSWISAGPTYEFRLYEGPAKKQLLAAVKVTCSRTAVAAQADHVTATARQASTPKTSDADHSPDGRDTPPTRTGPGILSSSALAVTVAFLALLALRSRRPRAASGAHRPIPEPPPS